MSRGRALLRALGWLLVLAPALRGAEVVLSCTPAEITARQGGKTVLDFTVRNASPFRLEPGSNWFISYHAQDLSGRRLQFENRRFPLPVVVRPRATARFALPVYFSLAPGVYRLEWDLVREGEFWGRDKGWETCSVELRLRPLVTPGFRKAWLPTFFLSGRKGIDHGQYLLRQVLRNNEIRFNGAFFGFAAGTTYPQVWIRDTATLMAYARFFYPPTDLQGVVDRFFRCQGRQGEVQDWIDTTGRCDKNTVESDQESSLVLASWPLALGDPSWLAAEVAGLTRLRRLDMALEWLWRERRDRERGLIWSGFTADWGDVERSYPDQRAIKLSDRSRRTFSIYSQALFIQAARKLGRMAARLGADGLAGKWRGRGKAVAAECRRQLYLPEHGYFLVHHLDDGGDLLKWEKHILAVGGNAEALRAGLLQREEIARLLRVLEERRREYGLRTVSFTLLPPYPEGFFPHPLLSRPWSYQNGGEWDWIGGRLVAALYQAGFRKEAERYLGEIMAKNLAEMNVFEWSDKAGNGQGASFYAGAAGVLGEAILLGHLGLEEDFDRYQIPAGNKKFMLVVAKGGDRFTIENSGKVRVDIASLSKKEICILSDSGRKKTCHSKSNN
ncbi:MAG: hypothetical protein JXO51_02230 [Candidatus Aminicenantes bacterium]|nr:hypothetical protein [Candidatus Aminicenantes bacterium]